MPAFEGFDVSVGEGSVATVLEDGRNTAAKDVEPGHEQGNNGTNNDTLVDVTTLFGNNHAKHGTYVIVRRCRASVGIEADIIEGANGSNLQTQVHIANQNTGHEPKMSGL